MGVSREVKARIAESYREAYATYRMAVLSGARVAGIAEKQKVLRQDKEVAEGVPGYVFDMDAGIRPLVWIALNLRFPMGKKQRSPMKMAPWEAYDIIVLFGWIKDDGSRERRFVDAFWEISRKNGKSTLAGAILDYLAFGEIEGARCYIGATSLEQAEETLLRSGMSLAYAKGDRVDVQNSKNNKQVKYKKGLIRAIAAAPKDGKLAYGAVIDEYHQHKSNDLIESIHSGNVSDVPSLLIRITTAGTDLQGVCHEEYEKCKGVLSGENDIPRYFVSIYELDPGDDPADPDCWDKANPNIGVSVMKDRLISNYEYAAKSQTDFIAFKTKNLNMWCSGLARWANMPVWLEQCTWDYDISKFDGKVCYGGLDLSSTSDFTSFTLDFPIGSKHVQMSHFWIPAAQKDRIQRDCRIPLDDWINNGLVTAIPGEVIDYNWVADYIEDCHERYKLMFIAVDKWNIASLVTNMPDWFSEIAFEFSQGMKTMSPTIQEFERAYLTGSITALNNPVISWMMSCAEVFQDTNGNIKLVKPRRRTSARIDGVITSIMALNTATTQDVSSVSADEVAHMITFF